MPHPPWHRGRRLLAAWLVAGVSAIVVAGPSRFGFSDRVERHLFPEVTTGPAEPSWSPDGTELVFSMHGDIWRMPGAGGEARALTEGPWYYFEPAWSPDGRFVAVTMDMGGDLEIGLVPSDGGQVRRVASDPAVDIEPAWSHDGATVYFASSRGRGFDIFAVDVATGAVRSVVGGAGDQLQPAESPDGSTLAYVGPIRGRLGTGGIWTRLLDEPDAEPVLVLDEESEYRLRQRWTPDGRALVFASEERGSHHIAMVPATGGSAVGLTHDPAGEYSPAVSPDGRTLAFISNRTGPMTLHTAPIGGAPGTQWRLLPVGRRHPVRPSGRLHVRVTDASGRMQPARIQLRASDGRAYAPDDAFARVIAVSETHYFHTAGEFTVEVPAGPVTVEALRGFEYVPAAVDVAVPDGGDARAEVTPVRFAGLPVGWYSGDTHAHDLHQGRFGLTHEALFLQSVAEDLHVSNVLIHMDGSRLMGRWADLTGEPHLLSTGTHMLQFAQEFRGGLGHIGMLGVSRFVLPLVGGAPNTPFAQPASDLPYIDGARAQGGIAGFMHPYLRGGERPEDWAGSLIPVDVALGRGDFYDIASLYSDELSSAEMYYRLLNAGFRLPATGGTDNFPDVWRDPPPGSDRTYARLDGPLTLPAWLAAVRAGRTFATTGPLVFLRVGDVEPGAVLTAAGDGELPFAIRVRSIAPLESIELIINGRVAQQMPVSGHDASDLVLTGTVALPEGGWVAARVLGPPSRIVADSYAFAHTSPVYVERDGRPYVNPDDARFLAEVVDAIWARASRGPWASDEARRAFEAEIREARAVYDNRGVSRRRRP